MESDPMAWGKSKIPALCPAYQLRTSTPASNLPERSIDGSLLQADVAAINSPGKFYKTKTCRIASLPGNSLYSQSSSADYPGGMGAG
jgi:hypothetical protein